METSIKIITKKWFSMFFLILILGFLNLGGLLLSGCAVIAAYEDIVGFHIYSDPTEY
jgi:hypothetical protein